MQVGIALVGMSSIFSGEGSSTHVVSTEQMLMGMGLIVLSQVRPRGPRMRSAFFSATRVWACGCARHGRGIRRTRITRPKPPPRVIHARRALPPTTHTLAQAVQAAQLTFEDFFMADLNMDPMKIVGFEGLFGSALMICVMLPLAQLLPGPEGKGLHEDSFDTLAMIRNSGTLKAVLGVDMFALLAYNMWAGGELRGEGGGAWACRGTPHAGTHAACIQTQTYTHTSTNAQPQH